MMWYIRCWVVYYACKYVWRGRGYYWIGGWCRRNCYFTILTVIFTQNANNPKWIIELIRIFDMKWQNSCRRLQHTDIDEIQFTRCWIESNCTAIPRCNLCCLCVGREREVGFPWKTTFKASRSIEWWYIWLGLIEFIFKCIRQSIYGSINIGLIWIVRSLKWY